MKRRRQLDLALATTVAAAALALGACERTPYRSWGRLDFPEDGRVAHALGRADGLTYSNSLEALEQSWALGFRWFEVDLAFTADGDLVCFHERYERNIGLDGVIDEITTADFLSRRWKERFTLISFRELLEEMRQREDLVLVTDTKGIDADVLAAIERDVSAVDPSLRRRIVLQMYTTRDLPTILEHEERVGRFGGIIFTLYMTQIPDPETIAFVEDSGLEWITMSTKRFRPPLVEGLKATGARIFVHTPNDPEEIDSFLAAGADGVYTDGPAPEKARNP